MDILIPLPLVIAGALAALGVGYLFALVTTDNRHRKIAAERETQIQHEYSNFKRDVSEHFSQSSKLFSQVTDQYRELYRHMADGAQLLGGTPPTPMIERLERERSTSRESRTEPQLIDGGLDDALVELRDDLHQFTSRLESRRKKSAANAKQLAQRAAQPKPVRVDPAADTTHIDLWQTPQASDLPPTTKNVSEPKSKPATAPRARHRTARTESDRHTPAPDEPMTPGLIPASAAPARAHSRVRSQQTRTPKTLNMDSIPVLDTATLQTSAAARALDHEAVKWQKLVDEWNPNGVSA